MNQVIASPNNKDTLLLVAVPKGSQEHDFTEEQYLFYRFEGIGYIRLVEYPLAKIIGLASSITEEQAKELVNADDTGDYFEEYTNKKGDRFTATTAKQSVQSLVESSGLTIGKDQDCLILKLN